MASMWDGDDGCVAGGVEGIFLYPGPQCGWKIGKDGSCGGSPLLGYPLKRGLVLETPRILASQSARSVERAVEHPEIVKVCNRHYL